MKFNNPFDKKIELYGSDIPPETLNAAIWVVDTLELLWAGAQAVFEELATPEQAIELLKIVQAEKNRIEHEPSERF